MTPSYVALNRPITGARVPSLICFDQPSFSIAYVLASDRVVKETKDQKGGKAKRLIQMSLSTFGGDILNLLEKDLCKFAQMHECSVF